MKIEIEKEFKLLVVEALKVQRKNFGGSDKAFATQQEINPAIWSRIQQGETEKVLSDTQWLQLGRKLGVDVQKRNWKAVETEVFAAIKNDILFCKEHAKAMIFVDECEIGKTFAAEYLSKTLSNCFYIDASQYKTRQVFVRALARTIGLESDGKYQDVKANLKYYIGKLALQQPLIIVDEAGDLDYPAFLELKELWNATDGLCGWYMIGAEGLEDKIKRGMRSKRVGYREIFSRFGGKFMKITPDNVQERQQFYKQLITDVLNQNVDDKSLIPHIVKRCLANDGNDISGLRRAQTLVLLTKKAA